MTPTFSLGCGTWGGSTTTDNVNYRNLLNIKAVSRRQSPPQWFRVPSDTYFNAGAIESLRTLRAEHAVIVTDADTEARGVVDEVRRHLSARQRPRVHGRAARADRGADPRRRRRRSAIRRRTSIVAVGGGSVIDAAKAMRLFHESPGLSLRELTLPFLDARKRVAHYPDIEHSIRLAAVPTTAGTGSEVSPAAVLTVDGRKVTLVDYSLVPDVAIVEPRLTLTMPPAMTADTGVDALTARARGLRLDLRLALHRRVLPAGGAPDPRGAAACGARRRRPRRPARTWPTRRRSPGSPSPTPSSASTTRSPTPSAHASAWPTAAPTACSCARCCATTRSCRASSCRRPATASYVAPAKLAQMAWVLGLGGRTEEVARERLFERVDAVLDEVGMPRTAADAGIDARALRAPSIGDLVRDAFRDPSLRTNPRMPLIDELAGLLGAVCADEEG